MARKRSTKKPLPLVLKDSLAVRNRPRTFNEIIGNEDALAVLRGYFENNQLVKTWLFSGVPGSGKTTLARIIARMVNCQNRAEDGTPCLKCESCKLSFGSFHPDIVEVNAAVDTGIDDIRKLNAQADYNPKFERRVYIIDECHCLSKQAKSALLKTLEEPNPKNIYILCTTAPDMLPPDLFRRLQRLFLEYPSVEESMRWAWKIIKREMTNSKVSDKDKKANVAYLGKLKSFMRHIVENDPRPSEVLNNLEKIFFSMKTHKIKDLDDKIVERIIKKTMRSTATLDTHVYRFCANLFKAKIRRPLNVALALDPNDYYEFLRRVHYHCLFASRWVMKQMTDRVDEDEKVPVPTVNKVRWEELLTKIDLKDYRIPLCLDRYTIQAIDYSKRGYIPGTQVITSLIYDFISNSPSTRDSD